MEPLDLSCLSIRYADLKPWSAAIHRDITKCITSHRLKHQSKHWLQVTLCHCKLPVVCASFCLHVDLCLCCEPLLQANQTMSTKAGTGTALYTGKLRQLTALTPALSPSMPSEEDLHHDSEISETCLCHQRASKLKFALSCVSCTSQ